MKSALPMLLSAFIAANGLAAQESSAVSTTTLRGKIMCGYQGWFRCPGDAAGTGWVHWSREAKRIAPETLTFEMWPDLSGFSADEKFPAEGFSHTDGSKAYLFSSDHAATVHRHFEWMRDYGLDGAWLQHFVVELPGAPGANRYPSRRRVLEHVRAAAAKTGRVWALTFDVAGTPAGRIFDVLTGEWKQLVDENVIADPRYLRHDGKPVVQIWGFYKDGPTTMTAAIGHQLADFFGAPGKYAAFLAGGGDWNWRRNSDPAWHQLYRRMGAYAPWNVGNTQQSASGEKQAATGYWAADKRECDARGMVWLPVVYPGFSWDNLQRKKPGTSIIPRRGGKFLWEQFHELSKLGADTVFVAMFDEVDEGTAIFKVTGSPPVQGHFVGYEGLPADWYLRLTGAAAARLRRKQPVPPEIPIK